VVDSGEYMLQIATDAELDGPLRDGVDALSESGETPPAIVSISDIHGYLDAARSALLTLDDHPDFEPVVVADDHGRLHWADENYVLVFNGDLVDRGPANEDVLDLVSRLIEEAPPGRVRVTLGNHEALMLSRDQFGFDNWFSGEVDDAVRRRLCEAIIAGHVVAAYRGHNVTYAHAGSEESYDVSTVNESLVAAAEELHAAIGTDDDLSTQGRIIKAYPEVLGVGKNHLKGPDAGLIWVDFEHLSTDAPPQVVGHTRHGEPRTKGKVHCQNVLRNNVDSRGGQAVFVETSESLAALVRQPDGGVERRLL
jgi:hypothetical protein